MTKIEQLYVHVKMWNWSSSDLLALAMLVANS